jgi:formylglycine-generating enzyme required for sulfatase activity
MSDHPLPEQPTPPDTPAKASGQVPYDTDIPSGVTPPPPGGSASIMLMPGSRPVPEYELLQPLGQGGFGEVWKARGPGGFAVALKFIRLGHKAGAVELRSLEVMKDIRHPNLLDLFGAWQRENVLIVAMLLADRSLLDRCQEATAQGLPGIPLVELLEYKRDAARGIDHLNSQDIQHRDIKPHNLLLVGGGVKVADFGLAKLLHHTLTSNTGAMTPAYAAPEFLRGQTSSQSDQYALAVTYCELRGGRLPFTGSHFEVMAGHASQPPDLTMLPEAERAAVGRALAKDPQMRWPNCRTFVDALAADALRPIAPANVPSVPKTGTLSHSAPRRWYWPVLAGMLIVAMLTGLAVLIAVLSRGNESGSTSSMANQDKSSAHTAPPNDRRQPPPDRDKQAPAKKDQEVRPPALPPGRADLPKEVINSIDMRLKLIPAGKFRMGSPPDEPEREPFDKGSEAPHEVEITRPFYLGAYLVTQAEYERVLRGPQTRSLSPEIGPAGFLVLALAPPGDNPSNPSYFSATGGGKQKVTGMDTHRFPVENVTWEMAKRFCDALSELPKEKALQRVYRLPTETEWEYACREGGHCLTPFCFGNTLTSFQANFDGNRPYGGAAKGPYLERTTEVGSYPPNQLGLYDMHGNLCQWCQDWYDKDYYQKSAVQDPQGPQQGNRRVIRGGSWGHDGRICRAAYRDGAGSAFRSNLIGFRVVLVVGARAP